MTIRAARLILGSLFLALATQSHAAEFVNNATIGVTNTNYDGQDIDVIGCIVTIEGSHHFASLTIVGSGQVAVPTNSSGILELTITDDVYIEAGSSIDASGLGSGSGIGEGKDAETDVDGLVFSSGGGGGYGGAGGSGFGEAQGGQAYGLINAPTNTGSGGGYGFGSGGNGGGFLSLAVGGELFVDGAINANGRDGVSLASGGGSGGGIFISAATVTGGGSITANGGTSEGLDGGGGGGGRIVLVFTTNSFTGTLSAFGGQGMVAGGAGTIDLQNSGGTSQIFVDNGGTVGTNTPLSVPSSSLTIRGGSIAYFTGPAVTLLNLEIDSNSWLETGPSAYLYTLSLTVASNLIIEPDSGINFDGGGGLTGGVGTGGTFHTNGLTFGGGGGNGGNGGAGLNAAGGLASGTYTNPNAVGAPGGAGTGVAPYNSGGAGGGAFTLNVSKTLTLNGSISANGEAGIGDGSGGGAGGTLNLTVGALVGNGTISANGGEADSTEGGGGGGGRVSVLASSSSNVFTGLISAHGGMGLVNGGAGTLYVRLTQFGEPQLALDNAGLAGAVTPISSSIQGVDLTITNSAIATLANQASVRNLMVASNSFIIGSVSGGSPLALSATSNATVQATGGIIVDGENLLTGSAYTFGGGGYGGAGGNSATGAGGPVGGLVALSSQLLPGSAGGGGAARGAGAGGGALSINVTGSLLVNGLISANGLAGVAGTGGGGGSGGGIYLTASQFSGTGNISANGGAGDSFVGGGGGGGRIEVAATTNSFAGAITAHGGPGFMAGGAGTIYLLTAPSPYGQLTLDNGGLMGTNTPLINLPECDLTVTNGAIAAIGPGYSAPIRNLLIGSNSSITQSLPYVAGALTLRLSGNATIQAGGGIIVDGTGNLGGQGSDSGFSSASNNLTTGGGGGNIGAGGTSAFGARGGGNTSSTYLLSDNAGSLGSGGGMGGGISPLNLGGAGGGSLLLQVEGSLTLNGKLSANGAPGAGEGSGGGAGGAVTVIATTLSGNGTISANGGAGQLPYGGGGGGGIVQALPASSNQFTGTLSAHGGLGANAGGAGYAIAEYPQKSIEITEVILDNGGLSGTNTPAPSISSSYDLTVSGGAIMAMTPNALSGSPRNLLVGSNSFIIANSVQTGALSLTLSSNATIQPTGGIVMDGLGYTGGTGVDGGAGQNFGTNGSGGGYGGPGGMSASGAPGGIVYGVISEPQSLGSGGAGLSLGGGAGGGDVRISAVNTLSVGGLISANGNPGRSPGGSGGGSGGSIWLTAGRVTGAGVITANGGAGLAGGGGGGGGRIAVTASSNSFTGVISNRGGTGFANGGAGTLFTALNSEGAQATITMDNGGLRSGPTSLSGVQSISSLVIQNGAAVVSPPQLTGNLLIASNGFLLQTNSQPLVLSVRGNVTVQVGGSILLDGGGNSTGLGSGANSLSTEGYATGGGGGHGGYGGASQSGAAGGPAFDQFNNPTAAGSGGGPGAILNAAAARGGGALELSSSGTVQIDGLISANGAATTDEAGGGGSGGALNLTGAALAGAGVISVNGGSGDLPNGGGGGGGRIALRFATNRFTGSLQARGGAGFMAGGAGTVYSVSGASSQLSIDNGGLIGAVTPIGASPAYGLTASGGATVVPQTPGVEIELNNLIVRSNAVITQPGVQTNLYLAVLGDALVDTNAAISVDGQGYSSANPGPGAGAVTTDEGSGGGYGGSGGASASGSPGGAVYGTAQEPTLSGSEGGDAFIGATNFSQGGGAVHLEVTGTLTLNGTISANGAAGLLPGSGGGSGGSVWLVAAAIAGHGAISANGGAGQGGTSAGGGGGGGRIAIHDYSITNAFGGTATVAGGVGFSNGQPGTLYISATNNGPTVIAQSPNSAVRGPVSSVQLTFDSTLNPVSIAPAEVTLVTPANVISSGNLTVSSRGANLTISFPPQSVPGPYTVEVTSGIENIFGSAMTAPYTGNFSILPPPPVSLAASAVSSSPASLTLQWTGMGGVSYQIQVSQDLIHWQPYGPPITSSNGPNSLVLPVGSDTGSFFRLVPAN